MLSLPMLSSSSSLPIKSTASATEAGEHFEPPEAAGFANVLAHELNGKDSVSDAGITDASTALNNEHEHGPAMAGADNPSIMAGVKSQTQKNATDAETDAVYAAVMIPPGLADLVPALPGAGTLRLSEAGTESRANAWASVRTGAGAEIRVDARITGGADASAYFQVSAEAEERTAALPNGLQAGVANHTARHAAATSLQPWGDALHSGKADRNAISATDTGSRTWATINPEMQVASPRARQSLATQGASFASMISGPASDLRRNASSQLESGLPGFSLAGTAENAQIFVEEAIYPPQNPMAGHMEPEFQPAGITADPGQAAAESLDPAALRLEPRLGTMDWDNAVGQKILWMVTQQQHVAALTLNPPDLGPLQVMLSITNDQASATFVSQHADVRHALEAALPRLKEMMAENGINLGNATVSSDNSRQQSGFERQDSSGARSGRGGSGGQMATAVGHIGISATANDITRNRLVDTFA